MIKITLMGLGIVLVNFLTLLYYDPLYLTNKDVANGMAVGPPQWIYFTCVIFFESGREDVFDDAVFIAGLLVCLCINLWMRLMGMCGTDFEERCEMLKCVLVNKHVGREWRGPSGRCSITV